MILSIENIRCPFCESDGPFTIGKDLRGNMTLTCDTCGEIINVSYVEQETVDTTPAPRSRAMRRFLSRSAAFRKRRIANAIYTGTFPYYNNLHQYSKNKIHCSCPLCQAKSTRRREGHVWKHSDNQKMERMDYQVREYLMGELEETPA